MTNKVEPIYKGLSQLPPPPAFDIVLIDVKKAANREIQCVTKSLTEKPQYVAISYRWGELYETTIDTKLGYLASVTSFDLKDFYQLCTTMTTEPTIATIPYVWIDAICVDQANHEHRKATIHHMSAIYEHAQWILAVPDLHAAHLWQTMANNQQSMTQIQNHKHYIYHLIHGNIDQLDHYDDLFLDSIDVPNDFGLRRMLKRYTDAFTDGLMHFRERHRDFDPIKVIDHLYIPGLPSVRPSCDSDDEPEDTSVSIFFKKLIIDDERGRVEREIQRFHPCNDPQCPLKYAHYATETCCPPTKAKQQGWHHAIMQRGTALRQAMHFLTDLVMDWSSRVWVISEYSISKRKNNMKFWFTQLASPSATFFKFDLCDAHLAGLANTPTTPLYKRSVVCDPVYLIFYQQLFKQLNRQTFVEMMLKSKASKNEDRFYAILPLFAEYKDLLRQRDWRIHSIVGVKLRLYQVMSTNDKLDLVYHSGQAHAAALPTFATSTILWQGPAQYKGLVKYRDDLTCHFNITLHQAAELYYLDLRPLLYYTTAACLPNDKNALGQQLDLDGPLTMVCIPNNREARPNRFHEDDHFIYLMGSFAKNTWILGHKSYIHKDIDWSLCHMDDTFPGFHVY